MYVPTVIGLVLLGIAVMRAGVLPRWAGLLLIIGMLLDLAVLIGATETTHWSWAVTARRSGRQRLVLFVSRLVKYEGQDYWREVETYQADNVITVPLSQRITSVDWKWLIGILVTLVSLPFVSRLFSRRKKEQ